jgi:hypothetical protein
MREWRELLGECVSRSIGDRVTQVRAITTRRTMHPQIKSNIRWRIAHSLGQRCVLKMYDHRRATAARNAASRGRDSAYID